MTTPRLIIALLTITLATILFSLLMRRLVDNPTSPTWEITIVHTEHDLVLVYMDSDTTGYRHMLPGAAIRFDRVVQ